MIHSTISQRRPASNRAWLPSLLLLAQFLSITPVLWIVAADDHQRSASDESVALLSRVNSSSIPLEIHESLAQVADAERHIAQRSVYLKIFMAGACLLACGVVLVIRKFRTDAATQRKLEQDLRTTNDEVIAALEAVRSESEAKNRLLAQVGLWLKKPQTAESLSGIADQVVTYAEVEAGILRLESVELEPEKLMGGILDQFQIQARRRDVKLKSEVGKGLPARVKGDPTRLRQILDSLIQEAISRAEPGDLVLHAEGAPAAAARKILRFEVRFKGSLTAEVASSGAAELGTTISRRLVELMGGKLEFRTGDGRASSLCFTAVVDAVAKAPLPPTALQGVQERRTERRQGINYPTLLRSENAGVASVRILDVSPSGLRVSAPFRLEPESEVEVRVEGMSVVGMVRHCTPIRPNEFHVGIEVQPASEGDRQFMHHLHLMRAE